MTMERPTIVCLCGSTRFYDTFQRVNFAETMAGKIVLSVGFYPHAQEEVHGEEVGVTPEQKRDLDALHLRKIDLADEVLILNVGGYVGDSTRRELAYARAHSKRIRFLEDELRDWQVCWYQSLLLLTNAPVEVEVLEENLTQAEAERKAREEYPALFKRAGGMVFLARRRPLELPDMPPDMPDVGAGAGGAA